MPASEISREDYFALTGLAVLAQRNRLEQERLSEAVAKITGEERSRYGHFDAADEFVIEAGSGSEWGNLEQFLIRQEISVAREGSDPP